MLELHVQEKQCSVYGRSDIGHWRGGKGMDSRMRRSNLCGSRRAGEESNLKGVYTRGGRFSASEKNYCFLKRVLKLLGYSCQDMKSLLCLRKMI